MTLICSIFGTYFVFEHPRQKSIALVIFFAVLSLQSLLFFTISWQKLVDVLKELLRYTVSLSILLQHHSRRMSREKAKQSRYKIKNLPVIGVSDGGFRRMESTSTLLHLDFSSVGSFCYYLCKKQRRVSMHAFRKSHATILTLSC